MPNLKGKELERHSIARQAALRAGLPAPKYTRAVKPQGQRQMMTLTSKPVAPVALAAQALSPEVVREQALQQARYDVIQASGNANRPLGRKTFVPLPEFKPAQRIGHDQLGFCAVRRDMKQLSQAQDKVWADAYREGVQASKGQTLAIEPAKIYYIVCTVYQGIMTDRFWPSEQARKDYIKRLELDVLTVCKYGPTDLAEYVLHTRSRQGLTSHKCDSDTFEYSQTPSRIPNKFALGKDTEVSSVNLSNEWAMRDRPALDHNAPPVLIPSSVNIAPAISSMKARLDIIGEEKTAYNSANGTNRRAD